MSSPYLIVTLGPTGSGKTDLTNKTVSHLGLNPDNVKLTTEQLDKIIENSSEFEVEINGSEITYNI